MKILVVEDDQDARELLAMMLAPHEVGAVASVDAAIGAIANTCPDLIVSDLRLGNDSARRLEALVLKQGLQIPFLIISGYVSTADEPQGLIKAYLGKPFETAALLEAVASAMSSQTG